MIALLRRVRRLLWVAGIAAFALHAGGSPPAADGAIAAPVIVA